MNIKRSFVHSFKNRNNNLARNSFEEHYMSLIEIKVFATLMILKCKKNMPKCRELMVIQQETY